MIPAGRRATRHDEHLRRRFSRWAWVVLLTAMVAVSTAVAQAPVAGTLTASSIRLDGEAPLHAEAYLLGFRTDGSDESPYAWSFQAERLDVVLATRHVVAGLAVDGQNQTEMTAHDDAYGILLERYPLAFLMATSAASDDAAATLGLGLDLPPAQLEASGSIDFDTSEEFLVDDPTDTYNNDLSNLPYHTYQQPWPNLEQKLSGFHGAVTLTGDFIVHTFDAVFQVHDRTGKSTTYNATYGGGRGSEGGTIPNPPPAEYNVTEAELRFTNATFTFYPAGRPLQFYLRSAELDATGRLALQDVDGFLRDGRGVDTALDGSMVELDARDLRLDARPAVRSNQAPPDLQLAFNGSIDSATVDGRVLDLNAATTTSPSGGTSPVPPVPGAGTSSPSAWWFVVAGLLVAALWVGVVLGRREYQAHMNPELVTRQGHAAMEKGHITRARALVHRVLRHHPLEPEAVALRAMLHLQRRQNGEALAFLGPYLDGPADEDGALSILYCVALRREKGTEKARTFLRKAVQKHPSIRDIAQQHPQFDFNELLAGSHIKDEGASYM